MTMKIRKVMALAVALGLAGMAGTASADLTLKVTVEKTKNVGATVDIDIDKNIDIDVTLSKVYEGAAEAMANLNVTNTDNTVKECDESCEPYNGPLMRDQSSNPDLMNMMIKLDAEIKDSIKSNAGIVGVNQDVGNMVNQANVVSVAVADFHPRAVNAALHLIASDAQSEIDQVNARNNVRQDEVIEDPTKPFDDIDKNALIKSSINKNSGLVGVNQNLGNMNNQSNGLALAVGLGNALVVTEAALGQENSENTVTATETVKLDMIKDSVNKNSGVVQVNQSSGNMNNQGSAIAFGALKVDAVVGVPGT